MKTVLCKKLGFTAEALEEPPFPGALGEKIYQHISKEAWDLWVNYQTMLINEYQLNMMENKDREFIQTQLENFLFGEEKSMQSHQWDYSKDYGPDCWGDLKEEFILCKTGTKQSPINIKQVEKTHDHSLDIHYQHAPLEIKYNHHSLYVHFEGTNEYVVFNQKKYHLIQLHFHAPSEHWLEDKIFPMEIHFVHKNELGEILVLGVFIKPGQSNDYLKRLFEHIPFEKGEEAFAYPNDLDPIEILPKNRLFYFYSGSLTTPPCSEDVTWIVFREPITASLDQIETFKKSVIDQNIRPVQPINDRTITMSKD